MLYFPIEEELVVYWMKREPNSFISYRRTILMVQFLAFLGALFTIGFTFLGPAC